MKKLLMPVLAGVVFLAIGASAARADDVDDLIRKNLDPRTFAFDNLDPHFVGTALQDGEHVQIGRDQAVALIKDTQSKLKSFKLESFKMIGKTTAGPFVSAVYESVVDITIENRSVSQKSVTHDIYERRDGKLWLIYSAEEDTTLNSL